MINIYQEIYNILIQLWGGLESAPPFADSLCVILSTFAVLFIICIPFLICWRVIRLISR